MSNKPQVESDLRPAEQWLEEKFPVCKTSGEVRIRLRPEGWQENHEHFGFFDKEGKRWTIAEILDVKPHKMSSLTRKISVENLRK